jgi:hypothetical protein
MLSCSEICHSNYHYSESRYAARRYAKYRYLECHHVECHYSKCRGAKRPIVLLFSLRLSLFGKSVALNK